MIMGNRPDMILNVARDVGNEKGLKHGAIRFFSLSSNTQERELHFGTDQERSWPKVTGILSLTSTVNR